MRKSIVTIISLLLIVSLAVCVSAASIDTTLSADKTTVNRGDSIVITVSVAELASCKSGSLQIYYNENIFSCSGNEWLMSGLTMNTPEVPAVFAFSSAKTVSGDIYRFNLKVSENAAFGKYTVDVSLTLKDASGNPYTSLQTVTIDVVCKHNYSEEITTPPTCTTGGIKTYTCTVSGCGHTKTEDLKALDHSYDSGSITTEPTCTETGVKTYKCTRSGCTHSTTESVKALDHSYDSGSITTEPTCTEAGVKTYRCTRSGCGHTTTESVKALDHSYDSGKVTTQPTCTAAGERTYSCTRSGCSSTKTESVKALGHSYDHDCDPDCNTCGETRNDLYHEYSTTWKFSEQGHWHACIRCDDSLEMELHVPGPEATETTDQICTICGYVIEKAKEHTHIATGDWLSDDSGHWHLCGCGETMDQEPHVWNQGVKNEDKSVVVYTCTDCGYSREEQIQPDTQPTGGVDPTQPPTEPKDPGDDDQPDGMLWLLIVLCIIGAGLLGAIIYVVIGIVVSKKQSGRFTGKK